MDYSCVVGALQILMKMLLLMIRYW